MSNQIESLIKLVAYLFTFATVVIVGIKIVTENIMKKDSAEIRKPCAKRLDDHSGRIAALDKDAVGRKDRILKLEFNYEHILDEIKTIKGDVRELKTAADKNAEMTRMIWEHMAKRKANGAIKD
jgi:hypothetical protein